MIWVILVIATGLRLVQINQGLWLDEATQAILSSRSLSEILFNRAADFHPPLSYLIYHFWIQVSATEIWLRLLSVSFGVITVWLIYKLTLLMFDKRMALISVLLMAVAPYHIYYSQEVRMYSMATFWGLLSMYFLALQLKNGVNKFSGLGFILATTALLYTHYLGIFLVISQVVFLLLVKQQRLTSYLKQYGVVTLLYLPWLPQLLKQLQGGVNVDTYLPHWREVLSLDLYKAIPLTFFKFSMGRVDFENLTLYMIVASITLIIFGYLIIRGLLLLKGDQRILAAWLIIPVVLALIASVKTPLFQPFRLLFILPAFYIILAKGVEQSRKWRYQILVLVLAISLVGNGLYFLDSKFAREDWRGATGFLSSKLISPDIKVLSVWPEPFPPYQWYLHNKSAISLGPKLPYDYQSVDQSLSQLSVAEVYLFEYLQDLSDPSRLTQRWLEDHSYTVTEVRDFRGVGFIYHYVKR